ncbi:MAG: ATP-binding protein [Clostridia bacterium]|nr:ATP-binding protein [Clostridia bacterium]
MSITNSQYQDIFKNYDEIRRQNRETLNHRMDEVYAKIPEYEELTKQISRTSLECGINSINGNPDAIKTLRDNIAKLVRRKKELLLEHGYPQDYLEPIYQCPLCKDTGYIDRKKCRCLNQAIIQILYSQSNIMNVLDQENFDNFSYEYYNQTEAERIRVIVDQCKSFIKNFDQDYQNLFFYGNVGVGKTFLTNCIAKELLESGHSVIYFSAFQLFDILAKYTFHAQSGTFELERMHDHIFNCDLLIIDDLGTENTNSFVASQLFLIIQERDLRQKATLISTNLSLENLANQYSERTFSRIYGFYQIFKFDAGDIRLKKKMKSNE